MERFNLICFLFLLELMADFLLVKSFRIKIKFIYIFFLQVPKVCANIICLEFLTSFGIKVCVKLIAEVLCLLFLTEEFSLKTLLLMFFSRLIFLFSVGGFFHFILLWMGVTIAEVFEFKLNIKDGKRFKTYKTYATPLVQNGQFEGVIYTINDITREESLNKRLKIKHTQLMTFLENIPILAYLKDKSLLITDFSSRQGEKYGFYQRKYIHTEKIRM